MILKGLLLLDQTERDVCVCRFIQQKGLTNKFQTAAILRMRSRYGPPASQLLTVKRQAAYDLEEENVVETERQMSRMRIDS